MTSFSHLNYNVDNLPIFLSSFSRRCYLTSKHNNNNNNKLMNGAAEVATNKFIAAKSISYYLFLFVFIIIASAFQCAAAKWVGSLHFTQNISNDAKNKIGFSIRNSQMTRGCCVLQLCLYTYRRCFIVS